jgi:ribonuclease D
MQEVLEHVSGHTEVAFDTEFIGEETYYPRLCLIQVGTRDRVFLVDPFEFEDLTPLLSLLASPDRTTLVHAGRQDLQIMTRLLGQPPRCVVDTQILAGMANLPWPCSLTKSVQCAIDAPLPPGMTFTAWDARPLSRRQCRYAADDVRYLPLLHAFLADRVESLGHTARAAASFACFEEAAWHVNDLESQARKIAGSRRFRPVERRILASLVTLRDAVARDTDRPPRGVLPDNVLLGVTRGRPESIEALSRVKGIPRPLVARRGEAILDAITAAREATDQPVPAQPREERPADRVAIDGLWHGFCASAISAGISPGLVLSRAELANWYLTGAEDVPGRAPWQREIIRSLLNPLLEEGRTLQVVWREGTLQPPDEE